MLKTKFLRQFFRNWKFLVVLLMLGIFFRFYNLEQKISPLPLVIATLHLTTLSCHFHDLYVDRATQCYW